MKFKGKVQRSFKLGEQVSVDIEVIIVQVMNVYLLNLCAKFAKFNTGSVFGKVR